MTIYQSTEDNRFCNCVCLTEVYFQISSYQDPTTKELLTRINEKI